MELTPVFKGFASYVPGLYQWRERQRGSHKSEAEYSYHRWLGHLILMNQKNRVLVPAAVAELGPGSSLGVGLAAILSGANEYYALDLVKYSDTKSTIGLLDDLVELFKHRKPVDMGWLNDSLGISSDCLPKFPADILSDNALALSLSESRITEIRRAIQSPGGSSGDIRVMYKVPWSDPAVIKQQSVDLIISSSVLEHIDDLGNTYDAFACWLKPGGWMSHAVDFRSHSLTKIWNGHWQYPDAVWRLIVGKKPYLLNRQPCSTHVAMMTERGFDVTVALERRVDGIPRSKLAPRWAGMSDEDLTCSAAFLHAQLQQAPR